MTTPSDPIKAVLDAALADKAASRLKARAMAWPEKIRTIERLRDATRAAKRSMQAAKQTVR